MTSSFHESLTKTFEANRNPEKAIWMEDYMKGQFEFYGLYSTLRKDLTKEVIQATGLPEDEVFQDEIQSCWSDTHREVQYAAQELVHRKKWWKREDSIDLIEEMITSRSWWDTVDFIASNLCGSYFRIHPDQIEVIIPRWNASDDMWLIRSSILFQLKYKTDTDLSLLESLVVPHLGSKEFFIQKAIGWVLREVSKHNPDFVSEFIERYPLKPVSLREAKKYI